MAPECSPSVHSPIVHSPSVHNAYRRAHQRSSEVIRGQQRSSEVIRGHQRCSQSECSRCVPARPGCSSRGATGHVPHVLAPPHSYLMREAIRWSSGARHQRSSSALVISAHHQRSSSALFMLTSKQADKFLRNLGLIVRVLIREPREGRDGMHVRLLRPVIEQLHERRDRAVVSTGMQGRSSVAINMPARAVRSPPPWRSSLG